MKELITDNFLNIFIACRLCMYYIAWRMECVLTLRNIESVGAVGVTGEDDLGWGGDKICSRSP